MHVCAYDEAVGVPTESAATLALRAQQVIAYETGVTEFVDPLGGAAALEELTDELETEIIELLAEIEDRGGALACIESGWFQQQLADAAYRQAREVETGERTVVGVNKFVAPTEPIDVFRVDPAAEGRQVESLQEARARRSSREVEAALAEVARSARTEENVIPACVDAVKAYATVGEIVGQLKEIFGAWRPTQTF